MKAFDFYGWGLPSKGPYLNSFGENQHMRDLATKLWNMLESGALFYIMIFIIIAFLFAVVYYYPYNNRPQRHYKMRFWLLWLGYTALGTFIISMIAGFYLFDSPIRDTTNFIIRISLINTVYSVLMYLVFSIIICNLNMPKTNAYRFFELGK